MRGLLGKVKSSPQARKALDARMARREGYRSQHLEMLSEQAGLELAESRTKQQNKTVDFVEIVTQPGKYSAVENYRAEFVVEGREEAKEYPLADPEARVDATLTPWKRPIEGVVFFNANKVRISGLLSKVTETDFSILGKQATLTAAMK